MPRIERARSSGRVSAPRSNSSAYARTAASGVRNSCDASATNRRSFRSDASSARSDDSICAEHRVERDPETTDLGIRLGPLDPLREIAGGDRRCGAADRNERLQPEPHDPEPERDDRREHQRGHEQLDRAAGGAACSSTPVSGAAMTRMLFGSYASIEARTRKWPPPLTAGTVKNTTRSRPCRPGRQLDRRRQLRLRAARPALELRHEAGLAADDRSVEAPELDVVAGHRCRQVADARRPARGRRRRRPTALTVRRAEEHALDGLMRVVQRAVGAVDQEGVERRVGDDRRDRQPDGRQRDDPQQEPRAQREAVHLAATRSPGCSRPAARCGSAAGRARRASGGGS